MSAPARKLSPAQIRAIAIKRSVARRAANDNPQPRQRRQRAMPAGLLADCVAAGGFDQNERYA